MNENYTNLIYNGIEICLSTQLIILGFLEVFSKRKKNIVLGVLCLLFAFTFIYNLYWPILNKNILANIILAGYKNLFYAPLICIYVRLSSKPTDEGRLFVHHLSVPFVLHGFYLTCKFATPSFYTSIFVWLTILINAIIALFHIYYLSIYPSVFKRLKKQVSAPTFRKYQWFYLGLNFYLLLSFLQSFALTIIPIPTISGTFLWMNEHINQPLSFIIFAGFIVFSLSESEKIKVLLFPKKRVKKSIKTNDLSAAQDFIQSKIIKDKLYTLPDFELVHLFKKAGVQEKHIQDYLKVTYGKTFKDFIMALRINEFKELIVKEESSNYKIESVAEMAGFNSRSTFYRNFKKIEGMSPMTYISLKK